MGLEAARRLYAAAAYEDALKTLERLRPAATRTQPPQSPSSSSGCCAWLPWGGPRMRSRRNDRHRAGRPLYVPDASSAPPRVRAAFRDVRARLLPAIAEVRVRARAAGVRGARLRDRSAGSLACSRLWSRSEGASADPVLRDVAVLAAGFKTLSDKASAPPPPAPAAAPRRRTLPAPPAAPVPPRIYDAAYPGLAVPTIVRQDVPQWPRTLGPPPNRDAVLEIVINEEGLVESARMTQRGAPTYDQLLLNAASTWAYVPAQLGRRAREVQEDFEAQLPVIVSAGTCSSPGVISAFPVDRSRVRAAPRPAARARRHAPR